MIKSIDYLMKNLIAISILLIFVSTGCQKETTKMDGAPVIQGISYLTQRDTALGSVNYGEWILIKGQNLRTTYQVDFNSVQASDSLIYADDTSVTVKIPPTLPAPADNPITVTTEFGSVTYDFKILQPAPIFTSFNPVAGDAGDVITLTGNYFDGVESVNLKNTSCEIVSNTKTEIKVKVPAGENFGKFTITTPSGSISSESIFGFQYLLFGDETVSGWWSGPWAASVDLSTEQIRRGTHSLKYTAASGWGGAKWGKNAPKLDASGFSGLKVSLYGGPGTDDKKVKIYLNGVSGKGYEVKLKEGEWVDFQISFINLGNPTEISTVTLQEFSGNKSDFYIDDLGFY